MPAAEPILDAALPIIDPHHHLWNAAHYLGPYMQPELLADFGDGHNIVASVFLECHSHYREDGPAELQCVGETAFANRVAEEHSHTGGPRLCAAIVAHADLMLGAEVAAVLEAHRAAAPQRFRGIRHMTAWDPDPNLNFDAVQAQRGMMENARFRAGFAQLQRFGLTFDAWCYHTQLDELDALARAFPDTTIVLDHTGTPLRIERFASSSDVVFADWQRSMRRVARCPNVIVKLGGLGMHLCAPEWGNGDDESPLSERIAAATRHYYLSAIDAFTPSRCMFESNFPVDKAATSYRALWNAFKRLTQGFSAEERSEMFYGTAARTYRLAL